MKPVPRATNYASARQHDLQSNGSMFAPVTCSTSRSSTKGISEFLITIPALFSFFRIGLVYTAIMKTLNVGSLLTLIVCALVQVSFADSGKPGSVRVLEVTGETSVALTDKSVPKPLVIGSFIQQGQVIKTGKDAKALLLMSNGTEIMVEPNTIFHVDRFVQTPFDSSKVSYHNIKAEPSTSQTRISVTTGTIIADVAKLAKGSSFKIGTPNGDLSIHGTLIEVTVNTTAGGSVSVTINLPQGLSDFASVNGQQVTLSNGQTVTVTANPVTGTISIGGVNPLNAQTIQQIQALAEQVAAQIPAQAVFEGINGSPAPETGEGPTGPSSRGEVNPAGSGNNLDMMRPPVALPYGGQHNGGAT